MRWVVALALVACSAGDPPATSPPARDADTAAPVPPPIEPPPDAPPAFPPEVRSLRLRRSTTVKLSPDAASKNLGTVAADTRVGYRGALAGAGCAGRWIAIEPRGWVCEVALEPRAEPPSGVELPRLSGGNLMPGLYGKVTAAHAKLVTMVGGAVTGQRPVPDSTMVRREGEATIGGALHWRIGKDLYVAASALRELETPTWRGVRLGDETGRALPLAFAVSAKAVLDRVPVWSDAGATQRVRMLDARLLVPVLERDPGGAVRIGEGEWLRGEDARVLEQVPPPAEYRPGERWIDLDLDRQVLIAYEGTLPVYATLVSSGKPKTPTETGIFRVWIKFAETDMNGQMADQPSYSVATVPWTQFYKKDFALHTAYWHDRFGIPRSHGCVNLSPADARFLYFWSEPSVPAGWSMAHGVTERPGSLIRVRSAADPSPTPKGYAAHVATGTGGAAPPVDSGRVAP